MTHDCVAVYIGENASLSFLDFLRHSLRQLVGGTRFTDGQPQNLMLEPEVDQVTIANPNLTFEEKQDLYRSYCAVVRAPLSVFIVLTDT